MLFSRLFQQIKESDSPMLSNIDALLVTDGAVVEVTYRSSLNRTQRQRGRDALLKQANARKTPGVYVWRDSDTEAIYQGSNASSY